MAKCPAGLSQPALCDRGWREEQVQGLTFVQAEPGHFVKKMKEMLSSLLLYPLRDARAVLKRMTKSRAVPAGTVTVSECASEQA